MNIVIVGPGALGTLLSARLFLLQEERRRTGTDLLSLHLLDYREERTRHLQENGLLLEEAGRKIRCTPHVTCDPEVCTVCDVLFLCVKATAVPAAHEMVAPHLTDQSLLLAMQNGIGHLRIIEQSVCPAGLGVTSEGATLISPGHVRHGGHGMTRLGLLKGHSARSQQILQETAAVLGDAGMRAEVTENPLQYAWAKLFVNVGINALSALHGCRNGELLNLPAARETMEKAVREAEQVARRKGIQVDADPVAATFAVCRATAENTSSMLQDVQQKRSTEIDAINGAIVEEGEALGIPTPVNKELVRRIKGLETAYGKSA